MMKTKDDGDDDDDDLDVCDDERTNERMEQIYTPLWFQ